MAGLDQSDLRATKIENAVKGFALTEYIFKPAVSLSTGSSNDSVRYYTETAADLTATAPMVVSDHPVMAVPSYIEPSWTRNTLYIKEYMAESYVSEMDWLSSDFDVLARVAFRMVRSVVKQVDTDIQAAFLNSVSALHSFAGGAGGWNHATTGTPHLDVMRGVKNIAENDYSLEGVELWVSPDRQAALFGFLIAKGAQVPSVAGNVIGNGVITQFAGATVRVSNAITATLSYAFVLKPKNLATWYQHTDTTSKIIDDPGLGKKVRVFERGGIAVTDPKCGNIIWGV